MTSHRPSHPHSLTRRRLLQGAGALAGGLLAGPAVGSASAAHLIETLTAQSSHPAQTEARAQVALAQADSYDIDLIRERVTTMLDQLGGLGDVVRPGDRVAIKTNLTGGTKITNPLNVPATESYVTHPTVTQALVEAVLDAGASEVFIVEAVYDRTSWTLWGSSALTRLYDQVSLVNLNDPDPYDDFVPMPVGDNYMLYDQFLMHPILSEVDVFMSVAKLKCHATAGVTLGMKNLVGIIPAASYRLSEQDVTRSALHGLGSQAVVRIPSSVADLVRARPIDFTLIDGVKTSEGSEGPWNSDFNQKIANVLVAGKAMLATDAVATAVMGFDPTAASFAAAPFRYCLNHLQLVESLGLGTLNLDEIAVVGASLDEVQTRFRPYRAIAEDMRTD